MGSRTEVCFPRRPPQGQPRSDVLSESKIMAESVEIQFVDESEFQNEGKWYFCIENSQWEIGSTISLDSNDSLAGISDFSVEVDSEKGSDSDYSHDGSKSCESDTDSEYVPEPSTSAGNGRGKKSRHANQKRKECSGGKQGRSARPAKGKSANSSNAASKDKGKKDVSNSRKQQRPGKKKPKALTQKDLDDLRNKLEAKRPMCWNYVSEKLGKQYVVKHYETHGELIQEIIDDRYNKLRDLVHHMFSHYIQLISEIANDFKKDRKAHLTMRWMTSLNTYLDRRSNNSKVCSAVFQDLANEYSSTTIRAVTGILYSLVYDFAQTASYDLSQPLHIQQDITPEDDVALFRMSGAALCQMIKLRKDTLSEKKGKRKTTTHSRSQMESELDFLVKLKETDKSHLPEALKILDEGHLTFVKKEFLNFVREADLNIREYVNERSLKEHKSNFLEVVHFNVYNDEQLLKSFKWSAEKCGASIKDVESNVIEKIYSDMLHKLCNTRTKEFFRGKFEKDLATSGKVVEADQSLRDNLKTFSIAKKR